MNTTNMKATTFAINKSVQVWCDDRTKNIEMDTRLAEVFAETLDRELDRMKDRAEFLWIVLANVSEGDWKKQTRAWQVAAAKARDDYHALCFETNRKTA
jgi:hypothetical protein